MHLKQTLGLSSRVIVTLLILAVIGAANVSPFGSPAAQAADLSQFRPGNIVSDAVFYDSSTMDAGQVQSFLNQKVPSCQSGYVCLKDFRQTTTTRPADAYCTSPYTGAANETAAAIIIKVAQACGINPQVLLVTLQKEQGLVTHTWPSEWRYTSAMGQGCPDTAACDARYYGFQNQVYGAARQFKLYGQDSFFSWYAPGRTWNVLYHPNRSCGSSPVFIENQATSNLYYYTPYQPNAAALRAGYGEGDGCSAYGNRNFYNYFTDWFGSTQQSANRIVRGSGDAVYLINAGVKHHIRAYEDLLAFQSRLGVIVSVPQQYINSLPTGAQISRYVHDPRTGTLLLLEADGTRHRFQSEEQIAQFGYSFNSYVNLDARIVDAFSPGPDVNAFRRIGTGQEVYLYDGSFRYVPSMDIWRALAGADGLYAASMDQRATTAIATGPAALPANATVRESDRAEVYLTSASKAIVHVPSLALSTDYGAGQSFVVPPGTLAGYTPEARSLSIVIRCGGRTFVPSNGEAIPVQGDLPGVQPAELSADACSALRVSSVTVTPPVFLGIRGDARAFQLDQGKLRHILRYEDLRRLNGDRPLVMLTWSSETATRTGFSAPVVGEKSVVQFVGDGRVFFMEAGLLRHVTTYDRLLALGGGRVPPIVTIPAEFSSAYAFGAPI